MNKPVNGNTDAAMQMGGASLSCPLASAQLKGPASPCRSWPPFPHCPLRGGWWGCSSTAWRGHGRALPAGYGGDALGAARPPSSGRHGRTPRSAGLASWPCAHGQRKRVPVTARCAHVHRQWRPRAAPKGLVPPSAPWPGWVGRAERSWVPGARLWARRGEQREVARSPRSLGPASQASRRPEAGRRGSGAGEKASEPGDPPVVRPVGRTQGTGALCSVSRSFITEGCSSASAGTAGDLRHLGEGHGPGLVSLQVRELLPATKGGTMLPPLCPALSGPLREGQGPGGRSTPVANVDATWPRRPMCLCSFVMS